MLELIKESAGLLIVVKVVLRCKAGLPQLTKSKYIEIRWNTS